MVHTKAAMNSPIKFKWQLLLTATTVVILITAPDLALWFLHTFFELLHGLFELFEGALDEVIEHLFDTDRHTTQLIVFYLMWAMALYPAYRLYVYWYRRIQELRRTVPIWWDETKQQAKTYWQHQSFGGKCKYVGGCLGMLGFSYLLLF